MKNQYWKKHSGKIANSGKTSWNCAGKEIEEIPFLKKKIQGNMILEKYWKKHRDETMQEKQLEKYNDGKMEIKIKPEKLFLEKKHQINWKIQV